MSLTPSPNPASSHHHHSTIIPHQSFLSPYSELFYNFSPTRKEFFNEFANEIIGFWYSGVKLEEAATRTNLDRWFAPKIINKALDDEIAMKYTNHIRIARDTPLYDEMMDNPHSALALIILLDQFSRNAFRGSGEAFEADLKAQKLTLYAFHHHYHEKLDHLAYALFFYLPLMHAEDLNLTKLNCELLDNHIRTVQLTYNPVPNFLQTFIHLTKFAVGHYDTIRMFNRYPARNIALGRESTQAEKQYLQPKDN